mgnify:CR=1 FL=1
MTIAFTNDFKIIDKDYHFPFAEARYAYFDKVSSFEDVLDDEGTDATGVSNLSKNCHFATYVEVPIDSDEVDHWEEVTDKKILDKLISALPLEVKNEIFSTSTKTNERIIIPPQVIENFENLISLYQFCARNNYNNKIFKEMAEVLLNN